MRPTYQRTMTASFVGYIVQAIVNNFVPLLFITLEQSYGIPLSQITLLITINFVIQLTVDLLAARFLSRIGYRAAVLMAHIFAGTGLVLLTVLPEILPDPFVGLLIAVFFYAMGGGLLEVVISPIVEACPTPNKEQAMSLLHSFYCWGQVGVVLLSTLFFATVGIEHWRFMALFWAAIPFANAILFARAPIYTLPGDEENGGTKALFARGLFWLLLLMMLCAGAAELTVSQWASAFAESGLGVSKTVGDLAGPMSFALLMGCSRLLYAKLGERLPMQGFMLFSTLLCIASYLAIALVPSPALGLVACATTGFAVGIFWPGTYCIASSALPGGAAARCLHCWRLPVTLAAPAVRPWPGSSAMLLEEICVLAYCARQSFRF